MKQGMCPYLRLKTYLATYLDARCGRTKPMACGSLPCGGQLATIARECFLPTNSHVIDIGVDTVPEAKPWEQPNVPRDDNGELILWRCRELESTQCFVLETPALVLQDGCEHVPTEEKFEQWRYPNPAPANYELVWTAVAFGSVENLDAIAEALNKAQYRMY